MFKKDDIRVNMSWIRVIAKKTAKDPLMVDAFTRYINRLTKTAAYAPGFINSNSYWKNGGSTTTIVSISDWTSHDNWEKWLKSNERKKIVNQNEAYIQEEKFDILCKRKKCNDIFLL